MNDESSAAATSQATATAHRAGETSVSYPVAASSSRRPRGRWLAGVVAISLLSATAASVGTAALIGNLDRTTPTSDRPGALTTSTAGSTASPAAPVTISAADAIVAVARSASPAVVTLTVDSAGDGGVGPFSVPSTGVGSGFVFDPNGLILTNAHVIEGGSDITVTFQDGSERTGTVVASDPTHDLAVVKVAATDLPTLTVGNARALKVGQLLVAIGSPLGTFTESVTSGILSATGRTIDVGSQTSRRTTTMTGLLQTDAAINAGNSGGPLLDAAGTVVGVNVAVATSAQGIGFAVPIEEAATIMTQARTRAGVA
ncbi:MAG TPA: trypsin-like peptidase domain-containing protein [Candidatus Limnocylindrales bacterium]|nr:trypsin-like peptidase domain-containing protein [Candidatus Limnocylindrales bacterium]